MQNTAGLTLSSFGYIGTVHLRGVVGGEAFLPREHMKVGTGLYSAIGEELGHRLAGSVSVVSQTIAHLYESLEELHADEARLALDDGLDATTRIVASHQHQLVLGISRDGTLKAKMKGKKLITWPQLLGEDVLAETQFGAPDGVVIDVVRNEVFPAGTIFAVLQR